MITFNFNDIIIIILLSYPLVCYVIIFPRTFSVGTGFYSMRGMLHVCYDPSISGLTSISLQFDINVVKNIFKIVMK